MAGAAAALVGTAAVIQNERSVDYDKMVQQSVELFIEELTVLMAIMTQGVPKKSDKLLSDVTKLGRSTDRGPLIFSFAALLDRRALLVRPRARRASGRPSRHNR